MERFLDGDGLARLRAELTAARDLLEHAAGRLRALPAGGADARVREVADWCDVTAGDLAARWEQLWLSAWAVAPATGPGAPRVSLLDLVGRVDWPELLRRAGAWHARWTRDVVGAHRTDGRLAARFVIAGILAPGGDDRDDLALAADPALLARRRAGEDDARLSAEDVEALLAGLTCQERTVALATFVDWALHGLDVADLTDDERDRLRDTLAPVRRALASEYLPQEGRAARVRGGGGLAAGHPGRLPGALPPARHLRRRGRRLGRLGAPRRRRPRARARGRQRRPAPPSWWARPWGA